MNDTINFHFQFFASRLGIREGQTNSDFQTKDFALLAYLLFFPGELNEASINEALFGQSKGLHQAMSAVHNIQNGSGYFLGNLLKNKDKGIAATIQTVRHCCQSDVGEFLKLKLRGEEATELGQRAGYLVEAVLLYRQPFVSCKLRPKGYAGLEWIEEKREEFELAYQKMLRILAGIIVERGDGELAIALLARASVPYPPTPEMALSDQQRDRLRDWLQSTFPTPNDPYRERPGASKTLNSMEAHLSPLNNLPLERTSFIGRVDQIDALKNKLSKNRLVTITGPGGCGKTRLSLAVAERVLNSFTDGALFVQFDSLEDSNLVPQALASLLSVREATGSTIVETMVATIKRKSLLLVFDNCEHVLDSASQLADSILQSCPHVKILATSRERLGVSGEQIYLVPSLSLPNMRGQRGLEDLDHSEAMQLFVERASAVKSDFEVTAENVSAISTLCVRLDGIPLAIELAAARVSSLSVDQINLRLKDLFGMLTGGAKTNPLRQQTLRALIDWSYELLNPQEQRILGQLSVFVGGCTLEAAEFIGDEANSSESQVLELIQSLVNKNLVVSEEKNGQRRFRMLQTILQYSQEKLAHSSESDGIKDRHQTFFLNLAEEAEPHMAGAMQVSWLNRLEQDHDNFRAAIDYSGTRPDSQPVKMRLATALHRYWYVRGLLREGREILERLLDCEGPHAPTRFRVKALLADAELAFRQGEFTVARMRYNHALEMARELQDKIGTSSAIFGIGNIALRQGKFSHAREFCGESLCLQRETGDKSGCAWTLSILGIVARCEGEKSNSRAYLKESLALFTEVDDLHGQAHTIHNMALNDLKDEQFEESNRKLDQSLSIRYALGDLQGIADSLVQKGQVASAMKDYNKAYEFFLESQSFRIQIGDKAGVGWTLIKMGYSKNELRENALSKTLCEQGFKIHTDVGNRLGCAWSINLFGLIAIQYKEYAKALEYFQTALSMFREMNLADEMRMVREHLATLDEIFSNQLEGSSG